MPRALRNVLWLAAPAVAVAGTAVALAAGPPVATTKPATDVGQSQATLTASVDPQGDATSVHFELGTTTGYGLQSASKDAGAGTGPVTVAIPVQGLTAATTYHFRVVATNAGGTVRGADATFATGAVPTRPAVSTSGVRDTSTAASTLTGAVNPHGQATTYRFQYGTTTRYGATTTTAAAGGGTAAVDVTARIGGLRAGTRYHYRLVATNATGTTNGSDRSFVVATSPTAASLTAAADPVTYGRPAILNGKLSGSRTSGVTVRLQTTAFPFDRPFADTGATTKSSSKGTFTFTLSALTQTTRVVVIADGLPPVLSPVVTVRSAARVGVLSVRRVRGGKTTVSGRVLPATANGVAALQRLGDNGAWVPLRRVHVGADGRYRVTVRRRQVALQARVVGLPHDGGAHSRGVSRTFAMPSRR